MKSAPSLKKSRRKSAKNGTHTAVLIRMPNELLDKINRFSKASYRTKTGEVLLRLEASFANESIDEHGVIVVHSSTPLK